MTRFAVGLFVGLAVVLVCVAALAVAQPQKPSYPAARRASVADDYFGTTVADPYRWMEDLNSKEVARWVKAENEVTFRYLGSLAERDWFKRRITELWNYARVTAPRFAGGRWFFRRNTGLERQSPIYFRTMLDGADQLVLDPNTLSPDGSVALSEFEPSPDGGHFVYGMSEGGSDWSTLYVRELPGGRQLPDTIRWVKFSTTSWTRDGRGFFYGRYPEPPQGKALEAALRDKRIYYHVLGTPQTSDRLIYERPEEPLLFVDAEVDENGRYLFVTTNRGTSNSNELFVKDLGDPLKPSLEAPVRALYTGHTAEYRALGVVNGSLYLQTDREAPNRRIVVVPVESPESTGWRTIVPEDRHAVDSALLISGRLAVSAIVDAASEVRIYRLDGTKIATVETPGLGSVMSVVGRFDRPEAFYTFTSPLYPPTVFRVDVESGRSTPFEPPRKTFDPTLFETERAFYTSRDGTRVPMFITRRRGQKNDGANPTLLHGYGGFDVPELPTFGAHLLAWLERGGIWATANLRGGNEYGQSWHEAGMHEKKQNVFDDFIAAAEYLQREGYASAATLGLMGESNGGLLVGAVMEQRPELFAVALPGAGVMDMLRYHRFTGGAAWVTEYGSSDDPVAFRYLYRYSPVHNVRPGTCYPATLVTTADHDDRVVPSHSFKFAALLQTAQGCARPILIRVETQGSHGYRPTDKRIAELADQFAFAASRLTIPARVR